MRRETVCDPKEGLKICACLCRQKCKEYSFFSTWFGTDDDIEKTRVNHKMLVRVCPSPQGEHDADSLIPRALGNHIVLSVATFSPVAIISERVGTFPVLPFFPDPKIASQTLQSLFHNQWVGKGVGVQCLWCLHSLQT